LWRLTEVLLKGSAKMRGAFKKQILCEGLGGETLSNHFKRALHAHGLHPPLGRHAELQREKSF
jgi:hypothetical protein